MFTLRRSLRDLSEWLIHAKSPAKPGSLHGDRAACYCARSGAPSAAAPQPGLRELSSQVGMREAHPGAYFGRVSTKLERAASFSYSFARFGYVVRQSMSGKRKSR